MPLPLRKQDIFSTQRTVRCHVEMRESRILYNIAIRLALRS